MDLTNLCLLFLISSSSLVESYNYWWRYALLDMYYFERRGSYGRYLRQNPSHGVYVNKGIYQSVDECRRLFKHDRWNCASENQHEPFGNIVRKGCRETAFIYALTSAGLAYEMVRACSEGRIDCMNTCKVDKVELKKTRLLNATHVVNEECNDNLKFGFQTWYNVVFEGERYSDIRAVFNIKNSIVGLKQVEKSAQLKCRCHGNSGSCILQVCSKQTPSMFRTIGDRLHKLYVDAIYKRPDQRQIEDDVNYLMMHRNRMREHINVISARNDESPHLRSANSVRRRRSSVLFNVDELKFFERSPDFCQKSKYAQGIKNRVCLLHVTSDDLAAGVKGCEDVCCRGHSWRWVRRAVRKNCRFHYCCKVTCDEELTWKKEYHCL